MSEKRRFPWWILIVVVGCGGVLCVGLVLIGGIAFFKDRNVTINLTDPTIAAPTPFVEQVPQTLPTQTEATPPAALPSATQEPTESAPTASGPALSGDQYVDDHSLFDDFSSDALDWPVYDDGKTIMKYDNGTYSIQIAEPEYIDWAYVPVDFIPYEIRFDVQGTPGEQDGTFGVFCQYQDSDNHYYVEFDLQANSYIIAQYLNGEDIPLTKQNSVGQFWYDTDAFNSPPTAVNNIAVSCYLDSITLYINDQLVDAVNVPDPFDQPGEAAFFVYAFSFADENGYKVFFDNVEVWQPVQ